MKNKITEEIIKTGAHEDLNLSYSQFYNSVRDLTFDILLGTGLNSVIIGWDCNSPEDVILNLVSIKEHIEYEKRKTL